MYCGYPSIHFFIHSTAHTCQKGQTIILLHWSLNLSLAIILWVAIKKKIPSVHFFKDFRVNLQLNLHLFVNQPHESRHLNVAGRTKYCDWTEEHVFYKSVSLGWGAPVVQELNLDKTIMDLKIKYFGTCTSLPDSVEEIQQFPSCTLVFVNTCQL